MAWMEQEAAVSLISIPVKDNLMQVKNGPVGNEYQMESCQNGGH